MTRPPLAALAPAAAYFAFVLGLAQWLRRRRVAPDITRALVQVGAALWVIPARYLALGAPWAPLPYLALAVLLYVSFRYELFPSIEDDGASLGPTLWPISCALLLTWFSGERTHVAATAILGAGLGDAAAGIVGRRLGTRRFRAFGTRRSMEGALAMFVTGGVTMAPALVAWGGLDWHQAVAFALITATVGASVETISVSQTDNVTVPLAMAATLATLLRFSQ